MKRTGIILAALLILAGCAPRQEEGAGRAPVTVKVEKISDVSVTSTVSYVGTAEAVRSAVVSAPNSGRLVSLEVSRGDKVSAGQELARIESQTVRSTLQMAEATLAQARDGHDRASQVYSSGSIPEVQMVEINTKLSQAEARHNHPLPGSGERDQQPLRGAGDHRGRGRDGQRSSEGQDTLQGSVGLAAVAQL